MNIGKRGDHLFAAGLWKAIGDVAQSVRSRIGQYSEGACSRMRCWNSGATWAAANST